MALNPAAPAGGTASLAVLTADDANDPLQGYFTMVDFELDTITPGNNTPPSTLRSKISTGTSHASLGGLGIIEAGTGKMSLYFACMTCRPGDFLDPSAPQSPNNGSFIGFRNDLDEEGVHFDYAINSNCWDIITNSVACTAAATYAAAAALANPPTPFRVGPFNAADAGIEVIKVRRIFYVPFFLVAAFLAALEEGDVVGIFWKSIYPIIVGRGKEAQCKALIDYFRIAATLREANEVETQVRVPVGDVPTPVGQDPVMTAYRRTNLRRGYPALFPRPGAAPMGPSPLSQAVDDQTEIMRETLEFNKQQDIKRKTREILRKVGGRDQLDYLLAMCGATSVEDLPNVVKLMIDASSAEDRYNLFKNAMEITCTRYALGEPPVLLTNFPSDALQSMWHMNDREVTSGTLGTPFKWNGPKELIKALNKQSERGNKSNVQLSLEEARALEKAPIFWSQMSQIPTVLRMGYIIWLTFTEDPAHPVVAWLKAYQQEFSNNLTLIEEYPCRVEDDRDLMGIQVMIKIARLLHNYSVAVARKEPLPGLNTQLIIDTVKDTSGTGGSHWEVVSSTMGIFKNQYAESLTVFRNAVAGKPSRGAATGRNDDYTVAHTRTVPNLEGLQVGGPRPASVAAERWSDDVSQIGGASVAVPPSNRRSQGTPRSSTPTPSPRGGGGGGRQEMIFNDHASGDLRQLWRNTRAKCSTMKKAADTNRNGIPPLPRSKKEGCEDKPICLNWHVMGECRMSGCEQEYDHIPYNEEELGDTKQWVRSHAIRFDEDNRSRNSRGGRGGRGSNNRRE